MASSAYFANQATLVKDFIATARKSKFWIYNLDGKRWYTPEEFGEAVEQKKLYLKDGWLEKYKIMNPMKGLEAAEILSQQLNQKKLEFQRRILEYYLNN